MIGVDRIVTHGLFAIEYGRFPNRRERLPLSLRVEAPHPGCLELTSWVVLNAIFAPVATRLLVSMAHHITRRLLSGTLLKMARRQDDADTQFNRMMDHLNKVEEHRHQEVIAWKSKLFEPTKDIIFSEKLADAAKDVVAPIDQSCDSIVIPGEDSDTEINGKLAENIRQSATKQKRTQNEERTLIVSIDGFSYNKRQLRVEDPNESGRYITAHVIDPAFERPGNVYVNAASNKSRLVVKATCTLEGQRIRELYITNAWPDE